MFTRLYPNLIKPREHFNSITDGYKIYIYINKLFASKERTQVCQAKTKIKKKNLKALWRKN